MHSPLVWGMAGVCGREFRGLADEGGTAQGTSGVTQMSSPLRNPRVVPGLLPT